MCSSFNTHYYKDLPCRTVNPGGGYGPDPQDLFSFTVETGENVQGQDACAILVILENTCLYN